MVIKFLFQLLVEKTKRKILKIVTKKNLLNSKNRDTVKFLKSGQNIRKIFKIESLDLKKSRFFFHFRGNS